MTTTTTHEALPHTVHATLSEATRILFFIAARSHTLAQIFGVSVNPDDDCKLVFHRIGRPWLVPHSVRKTEYTFDPDVFAERWIEGGASTGDRHMALWILNVWNSGHARSKGWTFDLFKALDSLDDNNRSAIGWHLAHPIWP
jgi:hypothetical protein